MQTWYSQLKEKVQEKLKPFSAETFFIGVSGGRDSVFLFHLFKDLFPPGKLIVLHLNHGLREYHSDQDQLFVEDLAKQFKIKCLSTKVKLELSPGLGGLENIARKARYQWFKEKMEGLSSMLFVGHTLGDHLETILMKIHRGSGIAGLKGISFMQNSFGVSLCRPLLHVERFQITKYLEENKIQWRDDHTNLSLEYFRNEIRLNLIPKLSINTKQRLLKTSILSNQLQSFFELPEVVAVLGGLEFSVAELKKLSNFEFRHLIEKVYHHFQLISGPDKLHMDRIANFLEINAEHLQLPNFINLFSSREKVFFIKENNLEAPLPIDIFILQDTTKRLDDGFSLNLQLPKDYLTQVLWRWADLKMDQWRGKSLKNSITGLKLPAWRKDKIPLCEIKGKIIYIGYLGVTENYQNLISGSNDLVTIQILNNKIKL